MSKKIHFARKGKPICKVDNKTFCYKKTGSWMLVTCDNCWKKRENC